MQFPNGFGFLFISTLRTIFRIHNYLMHPYNRTAPQRNSLRFAFGCWLDRCRFGIFQIIHLWLIFGDIPPGKFEAETSWFNRNAMKAKEKSNELRYITSKWYENNKKQNFKHTTHLERLLWIHNFILSFDARNKCRF